MKDEPLENDPGGSETKVKKEEHLEAGGVTGKQIVLKKIDPIQSMREVKLKQAQLNNESKIFQMLFLFKIVI